MVFYGFRGSQVGIGLFPLAALANHSCDPSASQSFDRGVIVFRAQADLPPSAPVSARRSG